MKISSSSTFREKTNELLNSLATKLDREGQVFFTLDPAASFKTFSVYAYEWWAARTTKEVNPPRLRISYEQVPDGTRFRLHLATPRPEILARLDGILIQRPEPVFPIAKIVESTEVDWLEQWAEFCIRAALPLEDVLIAADGEVPRFLPTSPEGLALITKARSTG